MKVWMEPETLHHIVVQQSNNHLCIEGMEVQQALGS